MVDKKVRVAYIVVAHKNPEQVARLVRRLAVPQTAFLIHVDRKSPRGVEERLREALVGVARCHYLKPRPVHWAHFSQTDVALRALKALTDLGLDPDHTVLSTGQDYPIEDPEAIARRLSAESERSYLLYSALPNMDWWPSQRGGLDRLEHYFVRLPRRGLVKTPWKRRIPHGWEPYGGAANWALGRPHREYVQRWLATDPRAVRFFHHTSTTDELLFQTVLMNSPLWESIVNDHLLFTRWQEGALHPDVLTVRDVDELIESPALFARKFDAAVDAEVLDELDRRIGAPLGQASGDTR